MDYHATGYRCTLLHTAMDDTHRGITSLFDCADNICGN